MPYNLCGILKKCHMEGYEDDILGNSDVDDFSMLVTESRSWWHLLITDSRIYIVVIDCDFHLFCTLKTVDFEQFL